MFELKTWWRNIGIAKQDKYQETSIMAKPVVREKPTAELTKRQHFVKSLSEHPDIDDKFDRKIPYIQARLETGNFKHLVGNWNFAGMKPPRSWEGKVIKINTHEVINGVWTPMPDYFCDFDNADDFVSFYLYQIKRLYRDSWKNRGDYKLFFWWLTRGKFKWATDTEYSSKLIRMYEGLPSWAEIVKIVMKMEEI